MPEPISSTRGRIARATTVAGVLLGALALATAATAGAQGAVTGVVVDSTADARPLAGAVVQLAVGGGAVQTVTTDATGAFLFEAVPAGRHLLGFFHPRVDALLLLPPLREIWTDARAMVRADLAIPAASTIVAGVCGARADSSGLLLGHVRRAADGRPLGAGEVTVAWSELVIGGGVGPRHERRVLRAPSDAEGRFGLCGVPTDAPVTVQAAAGALTSGSVELRVPPQGVLARDLHVAAVVAATLDGELAGVVAPPRRGTASLAGRVLDGDGTPRGGAVVVLQGSGATDTTDAAGAFRLDALPAGTHMVEARAIGLLPARLPVDLADGRLAATELTLGDRVPELDAVTVFGERRGRGELAAFLRRSRGGFGRFITAEEIDRRPALFVADLLRMVPGVRVTPSGAGDAILLRGGYGGVCEPAVFLDGSPLQEGATTVSQFVRPQEIGGIEVYAGTAGMPAQYQRGSCGSVLIWTRMALR